MHQLMKYAPENFTLVSLCQGKTSFYYTGFNVFCSKMLMFAINLVPNDEAVNLEISAQL